MTRRIRFLASLVAFVAFAFAQLAVAAHACDRPGRSPAAVHPENCPDAKRSTQCAEHCKFGAASVDSAKPLAAPAAITGPFLGMVALAVREGSFTRVVFPVPPTAGPPPRALVLRI